ncbi:GNAT family N-acetyltransferase [Pseudalkalibacillus hwajinpoensis]|uniref:GNAT family N-acetyltransferase n=1 Tax=Guptibacillus hwajinpoensis TaxID=208199 RepID=UPI001CFE978C|nr:GNAT family N-acetyltransferase [Pseudalkalibacillus hwajinpoensis]
MIRRLTSKDIPVVKEMPTGLEEDYVSRILHRLIEEETIMGYFHNEKLVGIAGMTMFEREAVVLGRLRTHVDYRNKGIASALMNTLKNEAFNHQMVTWVGYATEEYNTAGNRLAPHLEMHLEAKVVSSLVSPYVMMGQTTTEPFERVVTADKKTIIEKYWKKNKATFFPYSIYYPLPYLPILSPAYLNKVELFVNGSGGFMIMKEEKGASYLHLKVFNETTLYNKTMWDMVNAHASEEARTIWVDLPIQQAKWLEPYSHQTIWHLYGQKRSLQNEMD